LDKVFLIGVLVNCEIGCGFASEGIEGVDFGTDLDADAGVFGFGDEAFFDENKSTKFAFIIFNSKFMGI
jgi:hypothetical protein